MILSIDPGESTGVCIFRGPQDFDTFTIYKNMNELYDLIVNEDPRLVVYEKFLLYPAFAKHLVWDEMYTSQLIGIIKLACKQNNIPYVGQTANNKEHVVYPKNYEFINDHERDAYGHAWYYDRRNR